MEQLSNWIVKHRNKLMLFFLIALIASAASSTLVKTNFEMSKYLDQDMDSVKSLNQIQGDFGLPSNVRVMVPNVSLQEAKAMKEKIAATTGVDKVLWLDDAINLYIPTEMMPEKLLKKYYKDGKALFYVYFSESDFKPLTGKALNEIENIVGKDALIFGSASSSQEVIHSTDTQLASIAFLLVPLIFIILLLATTSWIEPILFLVTLLVAIVINNGTNVIFGEVSFITKSMSTALQLAISVDYAIFLLHRFGEERMNGLGVEEAMKKALTKSFAAIMASSVTTIAGFAALLLMRFRIGTDMGLVFGKGITISLLTVLFLFPAIAIYASKLIDKTHHRSFIPSLTGLGKAIYRLRYVSILAVVLIVVPTYLGKENNAFIYGGSSISEEAGTPLAIAKTTLDETFGPFNPTILMFPKGNTANEAALAREIEALPGVEQVQGLTTLIDGKIPVEMLPSSVTREFASEKNHRLIVVLNTPEESNATFETIRQVKALSQKYYPDNYAYAGSSVSLYDIMTVAKKDDLRVTQVSILAVALVILLTFRSLSLPVFLVFSIEAAVFANMSVPYFSGSKVSFIGMLVVSSLQLGSCIDYGILLTSRYLERRSLLSAKEAVIYAIDDAGGSILTSALILMTAGYTIAWTSGVQTVSEMGELIGRGTLLSTIMVFTVLPALLVVFDKFVMKTTWISKSSVASDKIDTPMKARS